MSTKHLYASALLLLAVGLFATGGIVTQRSAASAFTHWLETPQDKKQPVSEEAIRNLVKQLGDDAFDKREAADKALAAIGEPALEMLKKAAAENPDAEVRQRAATLIAAVVSKYLVQVRRFEGHAKETKGQATCVVVSPDGRQIVSAGSLFLRSWDAESGKQIQAFGQLEKPQYRSLAISADGKQVIGGGTEKKLGLFDLDTGMLLKEFVGHSASVYAVLLLPGGKQVVTGGFDRSIRVWDLASGAQMRTFEDVADNPRTFALSKDGKTLAAGHFSVMDDKGTVRLWDLEKGKLIRALPSHLKQVSAVAFSPDGKTLLSASFDGTMRLWDPVTGKELKLLKDRPQQIEAAAFSLDGSRIFSVASLTRPTIRVWDVASGKLLFESEEIKQGFFGLAMLPDGRQCVTAGKDGVVRLWRWTK